MSDWFVAHKDGLRQVHERLVDRRGFGMIGGELYQNVADTDASFCKIDIEKVTGKPRIIIKVEDDGHGFHDLTHAWTLFAPSEKKGDPTKAGRFNVGEKVVLSFAYHAEISTTTGTVIFNDGSDHRPNGRFEFPRRKRDRGTIFIAELACNQERYEQLMDYMRTIIVRPGLVLYVNLGPSSRPLSWKTLSGSSGILRHLLDGYWKQHPQGDCHDWNDRGHRTIGGREKRH